MIRTKPVAKKDTSRARTYDPIPPRRWRGERDSVVGPFSSEQLAKYFAGAVLGSDPTGTLACRVFADNDLWYVDICGTRRGL